MPHIISFLGGDSQVGSTMIAQSVAESLCRQREKVLFIAGSGKAGDDFIDCMPQQSIDRLSIHILSGLLQPKELFAMIEQKPGLNIISGTMHPKQIGQLPENTFEVLVNQLEDEFDYVIIDGGDGNRENLTMSALQAATSVYLIITQQPKAVRRLQFFEQQFGRDIGATRKIILNKFLRDPSLLTKREVEKMTKLKVEAVIPYVEYGWQAEMEKHTLMKDKRFEQAVDLLVETIIPKEEEIWKRRWKSLWPSAKP